MSDAERDRGPGVPVPPPVIFLAAFLIGLAIDRALPLRIVPAAAGAVLGAVLAAASLALAAWAFATFRRAGTTLHVWHPASTLVTAGPYRFTRNPIYLSLTLLYLGLGLWLDRVWTLALLPVAVVALTYGVVRREEAHLARRFGGAYRAYRARVRRWL
jgi:protein-S-isoprenylcysteine O-methyltransferase Ste14